MRKPSARRPAQAMEGVRKLSKGFGIYEHGIEQIMFSHIKLLYLKKSFKKLFRHVV